MGNLGISELLVILAIGLLVIGPRRLPEVARGLGEAVRSFQRALKDPRSQGKDREDEP
ncbi:MAG: twin-arginine translocase TatA/TatE family subunit [Candidatus Omnitrophica bacterium]|nr:twin-arginine translocase TatA/TatE family subunit [Candidatus Omnitrophota bacterium]